ncbi:SDR family oxidoreductase [Nocardia crassostreae]|uniref:SDR family oxidoreductase n=1 Tax=Nocardia crassostreae TaxID=53428 RepID=UPI0008343F75|nr:SDR family oxidoreductase [Nocardia crassostreae]
MRVFVTGATGFVGSAVVAELIEAGHHVVGLARSEATATALAAAGAEAHRGALEDLDSLRAAARAADGVIHLAFIHDFADYEAACATDRAAIDALGAELADSGRPLIVTSGTAMLPEGRLGTEEDGETGAQPRTAGARAALAWAERGVRVCAVRLPQVHGPGDRHGFLPALIRTARATGVSAYVGDGANRWPAAHRLDVAQAYRLALEPAPAGTRVHAVDDEGVPVREIAAAIGRGLGLPVRSMAADAPSHFEWLARFITLDNPTSSALTRERLGWKPVQPGLIEDLEAGHYFEN